MRWINVVALVGLFLFSTYSSAVDKNNATVLNPVTSQYKFEAYYSSVVKIKELKNGMRIALCQNGLILFGQFGSQEWRREYIPDFAPESMDITADGDEIWVVGSNGEIRKRVNGGIWKKIDAHTNSRLTDIVIDQDTRQVWVVGSNGLLITTKDGGDHWEILDSGTKSKALLGILLTPSTSKKDSPNKARKGIIVLGQGGYIASAERSEKKLSVQTCRLYSDLFAAASSPDGDRLLAVGDSGAACASNDGGIRWKVVPTLADDNPYFRGVTFDKLQNNFVAVGLGGAIYRYDENQWKETNLTWVDEKLFDVMASKDGHVVAVGQGGLILEYFPSTKEWGNVDNGGKKHNVLNSIASSRDGSVIATVAANGILTFSDDSGKTFNSYKIAEDIFAVAISSDGSTLYSGSSTGQIYKGARSSPNNWHPVGDPLPGKTTRIRTNFDGTEALVFTARGGIWKFKEKSEIPLQLYPSLSSSHNSEFANDSFAVRTADADETMKNIFIGGIKKAMLYSGDSGLTWKEEFLPADDYLGPEDLTSVAIAENGVRWAGTERGLYRKNGDDEPWKFYMGFKGGVSSLLYSKGLFWVASRSGILVSYDKGISFKGYTPFESNISAMAGTSDHRIWVSTEMHEMGSFTKTAEDYPKLTAFDLKPLLQRDRSNKIDMSFSESPICATNAMTFSGRIVSDTSYLLLKIESIQYLNKNTVRMNFLLPDAVPESTFTLGIKTTCPSDMFGYEYRFPGLDIVPWIEKIPGGYSTILGIFAFLTLPAISLMLFYVHPASLLSLQRVISNESLPTAIRIPFKVIDYYLLTGFLCKRPKVLDAWVRDNLEYFTNHWEKLAIVKTSKYRDLPLSIKTDCAEFFLVDRPSSENLQSLFETKDLCVQITGVAGIGKTTLSIFLGQQLLRGNLLGYIALPIPIGSVGDTQEKTLGPSLKYMFGDNSPSSVLLKNLVEQRRIVPIVDRLSERDENYQRVVEDWIPNLSLSIITTREMKEYSGNSLQLAPSYISSHAALSHYVEAEITVLGARDKVQFLAHADGIISHLVKAVVRTSNLEENPEASVKVTPLLATKFAQLAVELLKEGKPLSSLPLLTSNVYLEYIHKIIEIPDKEKLDVATTDGLLVCAQLAKLSIQGGSGPQALSFLAALASVDLFTEKKWSKLFLEHLVQVGVLQRNSKHGKLMIIFAIDTFAEVLGAYLITLGFVDALELETNFKRKVDQGIASPSVLQTMAYLEELRLE